MLFVKGRCARNMLPHTFNIGMYKSSKNFTRIKHIYNESTNLTDSCNVAFDTSDLWNFL